MISIYKIIVVRDKKLKERWNILQKKISYQFNNGELIDLDGIIYLVGIQELGFTKRKFKKDEKLNLMHIGVSKLLSQYGYYEFHFYDEDGWPHYIVKDQLPNLTSGEQKLLMKQAIVNYFLEQGYIS